MTQTERTTDVPGLLSRNWLFRRLATEDLRKLARYTRCRHFHHKDIIFQKGDPGLSMLIVVAGRVRIRSYLAHGKQVVLNIINPGELLGEIALLDGEARTADAIAIGDVEILELARRDFLPFLERHHDVCIKLLTLLCQRVRRTSDQLEDLVFLEQPGRLAKTLLRLAESNEFDTSTSDRMCVDVKLSQTELGALAGMRREAVNRQLHQWRVDGIVSLEAGRIWIDNPDALEDVVEDSL